MLPEVLGVALGKKLTFHSTLQLNLHHSTLLNMHNLSSYCKRKRRSNSIKLLQEWCLYRCHVSFQHWTLLCQGGNASLQKLSNHMKDNWTLKKGKRLRINRMTPWNNENAIMKSTETKEMKFYFLRILWFIPSTSNKFSKLKVHSATPLQKPKEILDGWLVVLSPQIPKTSHM